MKIGDLVAWHGIGSDTPYCRDRRGIIVDGPHKGTSGDKPAVAFTVAWFGPPAEGRDGIKGRHIDFNLEVLSENR
jgi:hypothetical protein